MKILKIEHLGLACRSAEAAAAFYSGVLGLPVVARETLDEMKLRVVKVKAGESVLELLEPAPGEPVISKFLDSRGEGIHHVCLAVEDLRGAMRELRERGYTPLWEEPRRGAGGKWVNFMRPRETFGVLIELNEDARDGSGS
ncbi:MAG TPA: methylmalonyl-CoA epimerase [Planctomycetota bacterium]|nr:methylmalonyl-CoA epimerase [Planctomycetota bacterium]